MPEGKGTGLFAGADEKTLYGVGRGAAFKVQMLASGSTDRAKQRRAGPAGATRSAVCLDK